MTTNFDYPETFRGDTTDDLLVTLTHDGATDYVDLTNADIRAHYRKCSAKGILVRQASIANGIVVTDPVGGVFRVVPFVADFPGEGDYYYDIEVVLEDGTIDTCVSGILPLVEDVTK